MNNKFPSVGPIEMGLTSAASVHQFLTASKSPRPETQIRPISGGGNDELPADIEAASLRARVSGLADLVLTSVASGSLKDADMSATVVSASGAEGGSTGDLTRGRIGV